MTSVAWLVRIAELVTRAGYETDVLEVDAALNDDWSGSDLDAATTERFVAIRVADALLQEAQTP